MSINVSGHMARKSVVKDLAGNIINLIDETDGGYIVRNRQVVNQDKWQALLKKEQEKKEAALAVTKAVSAPPEVVEARTKAPGTANTPDKMAEMESRLEKKIDEKFDAILKALQK